MFDRGSPRDRQHDGRSPQEPSQRYLHGVGMVCLRDLVKHVAGNFACSQGEPRNKDNSIAVTILHHVVPFAVGKAIAILLARWMCSSVTLDNATRRILPSFRN